MTEATAMIEATIEPPSKPPSKASILLALTAALCGIAPAHAATSLFSTGRTPYPDAVTHASGYSGAGAALEVGVCIVPGSTMASRIERPLENAVATWNRLEPTSANVRPNAVDGIDFESTLLHELGHCQGLGHTNLASGGNVPGDATNYTAALPGGNGRFDVAPGPDGVKGSGDDPRGDDVNVFRFDMANDNPYTLGEVVDATTHARDTAMLPAGSTFATGSDREVSELPRFRSRWSEAAMNQGTFSREVQRTLAHDDVAGIRYARSGVDHLQGTGDDYTARLVYRGIKSGPDCDIEVSMDARRTGFAVCGVTAQFLDSEPNAVLTGAQAYFNPTIDWTFNDAAPCEASRTLAAREWHQVSLPCLVGTSTSARLRDVFGDDLGADRYPQAWTMYAFEYVERGDGSVAGAYRLLSLDDELESGRGYWLITNEANGRIDVQGEYASQPDVRVSAPVAANGAVGSGWNLVGNPFRGTSPWTESLIVSPDGRVLTQAEADPASSGGAAPTIGDTACTSSPVAQDCIVARFGYRWNPATGAYVELGPTGGESDAFDGAWVFAATTGARFRPRMTPAERGSR